MIKELIGGFFFCKLGLHRIHQVKTGKVAQNVVSVILLIHLFGYLISFVETLVLTDLMCHISTVPLLQFLRNHFSPLLLMHQVRSRLCCYIITSSCSVLYILCFQHYFLNLCCRFSRDM